MTDLPSAVARPFHMAWSIDDTAALLDLKNSRPARSRANDASLGINRDSGPAPTPDEVAAAKKEMEEWFATRYRPIHAKLEEAVASHLLHLAEIGRLVMPANSEAITNRWLSRWKRLIQENKLDHSASVLAAPFYKDASMQIMCAGYNGEDASKAHERILSSIHDGNLEAVLTEGFECESSGERLHIEWVNWVPTLGQIDYDSRPAKFTPLSAGQIAAQGIEHLVIDVPTGELLINDWFRIPAFTDAATKAEDVEKKGGLSSTAGCVERTQTYANQLGFVSVSVLNSSPSVVYREGRLDVGVLGERLEIIDGEEVYVEGVVDGDHLGRVCTDLWWATIIDKQVLLDICSRGQSREQAQAQFDELMKEYGHTTMKVQVPPGKYHLYFAGDTEVFEEKFHSPDADLSGFSRPMFTLSPVELELTTKPTPRSGSPRI